MTRYFININEEVARESPNGAWIWPEKYFNEGELEVEKPKIEDILDYCSEDKPEFILVDAKKVIYVKQEVK